LVKRLRDPDGRRLCRERHLRGEDQRQDEQRRRRQPSSPRPSPAIPHLVRRRAHAGVERSCPSAERLNVRRIARACATTGASALGGLSCTPRSGSGAVLAAKHPDEVRRVRVPHTLGDDVDHLVRVKQGPPSLRQLPRRDPRGEHGARRAPGGGASRAGSPACPRACRRSSGSDEREARSALTCRVVRARHGLGLL